MKKPINRVAIALWIAAAISGTMGCWSVIGNVLLAVKVTSPDIRELLLTAVPQLIGSAILPVAVLGGLGYLIELVDKMRWNSRLPNTP